MVYAQKPNFVLIGLFCRSLAAKKPKFCHFWTSAFCGVASWRRSENVKHEFTTRNLPLSNVMEIFFVGLLQRLYAEIVRTNAVIPKRDVGCCR